MSFTAGVLIAVCFFDIIPEIFSIVHQKNIDITLPLIAIVVGYLVIHILEKYAALHHSHEGEYATHRHPQVGVVSALGLNIVTPTPEVNLFLPKFFSRFVFIESLEISIMALV
jgi:ZIP family zinc transporter